MVSTPDRVNSTPAILLDGRIAFVDEGGNVYVVNPDGSISWEYQTGTDCGCTMNPAIGWDGSIYVGIWNTVYAFYPDGSIRWTYRLRRRTLSGDVAVKPDGTVYCTSGVYVGEELFSGGATWAFAPDGTLKWQADNGDVPTALSIGGDGTIYFGAAIWPDGGVWALNPDGSLKWEYDDPGGAYVLTPPAVGAGQRIYAGSLTGFFAIGPA